MLIGVHRRPIFLGRTRTKFHAWSESKRGRALDHPFFKRECSQRHIDARALGRVQEQNPIANCERSGAGKSSRIVGEQSVDDTVFAAESSQNVETNIACDPRLVPSEQGDPADEA